ncbi:MAG: undecaprenyl diphosphate synthase family protein, partial [Candidatus Aenigmarchaeota archaeon]|nr:undecaprenyl diphosphate synthase family protein [Candidatus Aenigmarchaeota archaeon]
MVLKILSKINSIQQIVSKINMKHIAIIMDGNRRWATQKKIPSMSGHLEGVNALKKIIKAADNFGIKYLTVYAFSTEN